MKVAYVRRLLKENVERVLLITLLVILILYFLKEIYLEDIQLQILQLKYRLSLSALSAQNDSDSINQNHTEFKLHKKKNLYNHGSLLYLDDEEFRIIGAEISYYGIRPSNWVYYLQVAKQCGVNTIACSIPWNMHEIRNGQFDFKQNMDLRKFIELVHVHGFKAILRIGPWISNQLSLGGLPHWLIDEKVKLRVSDSAFLDYVQQWWWRLFRELEGLDWINGGPIIALQIESNYGAFPSKDPTYLEDLVQLLKNETFSSLLFHEDTIDGITKNNPTFQALRMRDSIEQHVEALHNKNDGRAVVISSLYFSDPWIWESRVPFHLKSSEVQKNMEFIQKKNISFILSDFSHGSLIGWTMGATVPNKKSGIIKQLVNGARHGLMTEAGSYTNELRQICSFIRNDNELQLSEQLTPSIVQNVELEYCYSFFSFINDLKLHTGKLPTDSFGFVYYESNLQSYCNCNNNTDFGDFPDTILEIAPNTFPNRASIYVNDIYIETIAPEYLHLKNKINIGNTPGTLQIILDTFGFVSGFMDDFEKLRKGMKYTISAVIDNKMITIDNWKVKLIDFERLKIQLAITDWKPVRLKPSTDIIPGPVLLHGHFDSDKKGTWIKLDTLRRGVIMVNGHVISRYFEKPERSVFIPEFVLKYKNEIIIYEEIASTTSLSFSSHASPRITW